MGIFYKPSSYRNFHKFFKKKKFIIRQGAEHMIAVHPDNPEIEIAVPRHKKLSNGLTESVCKKLVELGFDKEEIKKTILR